MLGLDASEEIITQANQQDLSGLAINFLVFHQTANDLPLDAFDGIMCSSVIEYVSDAARVGTAMDACAEPHRGPHHEFCKWT